MNNTDEMVLDHIEKESRIGKVVEILKSQVTTLRHVQWEVAFLNAVSNLDDKAEEHLHNLTHEVQVKTYAIGQGLDVLEILLKNVEH